MDKNAIKKYAVWAREELIKRVSARAEKYGISKDNMVAGTAETVNGILLTSSERAQRTKLIEQIKTKGYEQVMEEVAYTWFNRFCALRFMEVNNYLPTHIRVFTDENNKFEPQIMAEAIHLGLEGLDKSKVLDLKEKNANDELYKYLLITQCNALSSILPGMFQKISDYTELLFPENILREGSVIEQMITSIDEEDWQDAVQIIGWLYQYYNSVPKDMVFANLKKNIKIRKEDIPAATQLFTPDWIVRYMVENSLGRLWYEGHPDDALKSNWKYYLDEAEQEAEVQAQLDKIREEYKALKPEDIKCIDPCMGSGHILVYMFDVLMQIYESYGYNSRDAAASIVEKNLYGLDIDDRAAQLAYFAVMMKARQYDRRIFTRDIQPHVYSIMETNALGGSYKLAMGDFLLSKEHQETLNYLLDTFLDAKEYGSILRLEDRDYKGLMEAWKYTSSQSVENVTMSLWYSAVEHEIPKLIEQAIIFTQKYDLVVTNPPYMASSGMGSKLFNYTKKYYDDGRNDLYTVFILRCQDYCTKNGLVAMIVQQGWMSLTRSAQLRNSVYSKSHYINMIHLGSRVFEELSGEVVKSTTFVMRSAKLMDYSATYSKVNGLDSATAKEEAFKKTENLYQASLSQTYKIEGAPLSYWLPRSMLFLFNQSTIGNRFVCRAGMQTGDNEQFLRFWYEPSVTFVAHFNSSTKWHSYNKGGSQRKWYGNLDLVVNWENNGFDIKVFKKRRLERGEIEKKNSECWNSEYYFVEGATWSSIASGSPMFRFTSSESIFDIKGPTCFAGDGVSHEELLEILGYLNTPIISTILEVLSPTLDCNPGTVSRLPYKRCNNQSVVKLVSDCISLSKLDWDSFETSWDFKKHPLVQNSSIQSAFETWEQECSTRFTQLKQNEEELNRIFIDIYGLQDELTPEVEDKDVTVRLADKTRDMKSFISYAVGCMFGRYSLDVEGLAYAGGDWDNSKYATYSADKDNIIPICDDEYFDDDIVGRFVKFVEVVYGTETLIENLKFIADALSGKGQPKDVLRNYFLNDFFADHCKIYQKRPIYWLFDSGKKNGFKALIYMHRYQPDTLARMRTDYVHEQQGRYRTAINDLQHRINDATTAERVKLTKQLAKIQDQDTELRIYEEKIHHLADQMIAIDLDDGVKHNYELFQDVLAKIK